MTIRTPNRELSRINIDSAEDARYMSMMRFE